MAKFVNDKLLSKLVYASLELTYMGYKLIKEYVQSIPYNMDVTITNDEMTSFDQTAPKTKLLKYVCKVLLVQFVVVFLELLQSILLLLQRHLVVVEDGIHE